MKVPRGNTSAVARDEEPPVPLEEKEHTSTIRCSLAGAARDPAVRKIAQHAAQVWDHCRFLGHAAMLTTIHLGCSTGAPLPNLEDAKVWTRVINDARQGKVQTGDAEMDRYINTLARDLGNPVADANFFVYMGQEFATNSKLYNSWDTFVSHVRLYILAKYHDTVETKQDAGRLAKKILSVDPTRYPERNPRFARVVATEAAIKATYCGATEWWNVDPVLKTRYRFRLLQEIDRINQEGGALGKDGSPRTFRAFDLIVSTSCGGTSVAVLDGRTMQRFAPVIKRHHPDFYKAMTGDGFMKKLMDELKEVDEGLYDELLTTEDNGDLIHSDAIRKEIIGDVYEDILSRVEGLPDLNVVGKNLHDNLVAALRVHDPARCEELMAKDDDGKAVYTVAKRKRAIKEEYPDLWERINSMPDPASLEFYFDDKQISKNRRGGVNNKWGWMRNGIVRTDGVQMQFSYVKNVPLRDNGRYMSRGPKYQAEPSDWDLPKEVPEAAMGVDPWNVVAIDPGHHTPMQGCRIIGYDENGENHSYEYTGWSKGRYLQEAGHKKKKAAMDVLCGKTKVYDDVLAQHSTKTTDTGRLFAAINARIELHPTLYAIKSKRKWKRVKFECKMMEQGAIDRLINELSGNGKYVLAVGDGAKQNGFKGLSHSAPVTKIKRQIRKRGICGFSVDEYYTSQMSLCCHQRSLSHPRHGYDAATYKGGKYAENPEAMNRTVEGILHCKECGRTFGRDKVGARNILTIALAAVRGEPRPARFQRMREDSSE
jgi:hypothetical protein